MSAPRFQLMGLLLLAQSACAPTYQSPAMPPLGKSLLKINIERLDSKRGLVTMADLNCSNAVIVCDLNGVHKPSANRTYLSNVYERTPSGSRVAYNASYILEPGAQTIHL